MFDNEFLEMDRIFKIQAINSQYNLLEKSYLAFSGGKDSTILHYVLDIALPNNNIPRVFVDTGIEYADIREFVKKLAETDSRIVIIKAGINIKQMLEEKGYPFKSKEHCKKWELWKNGSKSEWVINYLSTDRISRFICPKILRYQFTDEFNLKLSYKCCDELKKKPFHKWEKLNNKTIVLTGMRQSEAGQRANISCTVFKKGGGGYTNFTHLLHLLMIGWIGLLKDTILSYVNFITHLLILKGQAVKDVHSQLVYKNS